MEEQSKNFLIYLRNEFKDEHNFNHDYDFELYSNWLEFKIYNMLRDYRNLIKE